MHKTPRKCQLSKLEQDASVLRPLDVRASSTHAWLREWPWKTRFEGQPNFACETWAGEGI